MDLGEERVLERRAAAAEIKCVDCRMKFSSDAELRRHRRFCGGPIGVQKALPAAADAAVHDFPAVVPDGGPRSPGRLQAASFSNHDLRGYMAARGDANKGLGALTLQQLQQKMNSSSLADLQARALQEEQQALASKLRAYKLSAVLPPGLQARGNNDHASPGEGANAVDWSRVGLQARNGRGDGRGAKDAGEGRIGTRAVGNQGSISAMLAMNVLAEQEASGLLAPRARTGEQKCKGGRGSTGSDDELARSRTGEETAEQEAAIRGRTGGGNNRHRHRQTAIAASDMGGRRAGEKVHQRSGEMEAGGWEQERAVLLEEKVQALVRENDALKRERDLRAENDKLKRQLGAHGAPGSLSAAAAVATEARPPGRASEEARHGGAAGDAYGAREDGARDMHGGAALGRAQAGESDSFPRYVQQGPPGGHVTTLFQPRPAAAESRAAGLLPHAHGGMVQEGHDDPVVDPGWGIQETAAHQGWGASLERPPCNASATAETARPALDSGGKQGSGAAGALVLREATKNAEQHLLDMTRLEQETAKLSLIKELVELQDAMAKRRQNAERDAWLTKQRRCLQEAVQLRSGVLPGSNYDPVEGFKLRFDVLQPLPRGYQQTQLVYGLYDGPSALMPLQSSPTRDVVMDVNPDGGRRTWISHVRTFKKLPPTQDVVCIVEVQDVAADGVSQSVGWTVIPLFDKDHGLLAGAWRAPLLVPPVKLQLTSASALREGVRFDVLASLPRVMVQDFTGFHGAQGAVGEVEAMLYVRLRACEPAPSPDDLDYESKMAQLASKSRHEWSAVGMSEYQTAHAYRLTTTPRHTHSAGSADDGGADEDGARGGVGGVDSDSTTVEAGKGEVIGVDAPPKMRLDDAEGIKRHKGGGAAVVAGDASMAGVPKEAWRQGGADDGADEDGGSFADVGPNDELLIILDAARFLPDNVSVSSATLSMLRPDGSQVIIPSTSAKDAFGIPNARAQGLADLDSPLHSPTFDLSCSFRVRHCDPSSWVVIRIDALDLHAPAGAPPVCVGFGCFGLFRDVVSGRTLTLEQGAEFAAAIDQVVAEARRLKLEEEELQERMPKIRVARGGWQVPLRSSWPLRGLWKDCSDRGADVEVQSDPSAGAQAALSRFIGEDTHAHGAAALTLQHKQDKQRAGDVASDSSNEVAVRLKLARRLVERVGGSEHDALAVTHRLDALAPSLIQDLPRLPCASLLVRVLVNPTEADMMAVLKHAGHASLLDEIDLRARHLARKQRAAPESDVEVEVDEEEAALRQEELLMRAAIVRTKPQYAKGFYNSHATVPSGVERAMLPHKLATVRRDLCARDALRRVLPAALQAPVDADAQGDTGEAVDDPDGSDGQDAASLRLASAAAGLFNRKVRRKAAAVRDGDAGKQDDVWVHVVGGALNLSRMCAYNPALGFQVAIDGAINLEVKKGNKGELAWPVAVAGVLPVSSYFATDAAGLLAAHTWFVSNIHAASTLKCPRWQEGIKHLYGVPFLGHRAALLVQVLGISRIEVERGTRTIKQVSPVELAWAAMPLFLDQRLPYIVDGSYQLPLYAGAVPPSLAAQIQETGCEEALRAHELSRKAALMPGASLLVRVLDVQRGATSNGHLPAGGCRNPVPPSDIGLAPEVSSLFLRTWPSLALPGRPMERIAPKQLAPYFKASVGGIFSGPDPIVSALLQKMHRLEAKEGGSVHGSVMGGGGGADGDKARGMPIGDLHAMLRGDTASVTHVASLASADQSLE